LIYEYQGNKPEIHESVFIGPGCRIIGKAQIKKDSSIWPNAVLRGDLATIYIGWETNIQDNATLHVDRNQDLLIGNRVTVGHGVILHGCTIGDETLVGMGAIILNGARIGKNCLIAAGALIPEGKEIPSGSLVMGSPGKILRELKPEEKEQIINSAKHYRELKNTF